ncbi:hypothetical protein EXB65_22030 [Salmonella enterica subsp. enterica]|nr:hypothetical protein [Salmonella enterica subsp. enterica]
MAINTTAPRRPCNFLRTRHDDLPGNFSQLSGCTEYRCQHTQGQQITADRLRFKQIAYFHERRSLNNFHRDRVITFEQIAE